MTCWVFVCIVKHSLTSLYTVPFNLCISILGKRQPRRRKLSSLSKTANKTNGMTGLPPTSFLCQRLLSHLGYYNSFTPAQQTFWGSTTSSHFEQLSGSEGIIFLCLLSYLSSLSTQGTCPSLFICPWLLGISQADSCHHLDHTISVVLLTTHLTRVLWFWALLWLWVTSESCRRCLGVPNGAHSWKPASPTDYRHLSKFKTRGRTLKKAKQNSDNELICRRDFLFFSHSLCWPEARPNTTLWSGHGNRNGRKTWLQ